MDLYHSGTVIIGGEDVYSRWGLVLAGESDLGVAEPKTYTVDIPGGNGTIDLTSALTGDVSYNTREMSLVLIGAEIDNVQELRTKLCNRIHGQRLDFAFDFDPGYTYHGRFSVSGFEPMGDGVKITLTVTADPYKTKGTQAFKLNATGGKLYRFESGRRKVHPVIECEQVCFFTLLPDGDEITVPAGTYRLNDVLFEQGMNECWINTQKFWDITWDEIGEGDKFAKTWAELAETRWDEVQLLGQESEETTRTWLEINEKRWSELGETGSDPKHWYDLNWTKNDIAETTAYLTYEWEDL